MELYNKYAAAVYSNARSKGFWDGPQDRSERCMLIVGELGECLEAHRKGLSCSILPEIVEDFIAGRIGSEESYWKATFEKNVKNTVEDEIADVYIRIMDYTQGYKESMYKRDYRKQSEGNFGADLLTLTTLCIKAHNRQIGVDWGYVLAAIEAFCTWYNIDLEKHIQWKMRYNSTRPRLHGKKY